jgi:hypothetical protein
MQGRYYAVAALRALAGRLFLLPLPEFGSSETGASVSISISTREIFSFGGTRGQCARNLPIARSRKCGSFNFSIFSAASSSQFAPFATSSSCFCCTASSANRSGADVWPALRFGCGANFFPDQCAGEVLPDGDCICFRRLVISAPVTLALRFNSATSWPPSSTNWAD